MSGWPSLTTSLARRHHHRFDGGHFHAAALRAGAPLNRAAEALKAMVQNTATVLRSDAGDPSEGEVRRALGVARTPAARAAWSCRWPTGARRRGAAVRGRHDPCRLPHPDRQGPVRGAGGLDGRIAAGREERHAARRDGQFAGTGEHGLHGHQRGQRLGHRPDRGHRRRHLLRPARRTRHADRARANPVPAWHQPRQLGADPLHAGDGAHRHADQRLHQGRLARGAAVRAGDRRGSDARDAAHDRHRHPGQGRCGCRGARSWSSAWTPSRTWAP